MDAIFFDLDGTLTDPEPGITGSIQYSLQKLDLPVPTQDELTWCIGPLRASFVVMLGGDSRADLALSLYRERFADVGLYENSIYPGIEHVLAALNRSHRRLFVATSKPRVYAERIIAHFGLADCFDYGYGSREELIEAGASHVCATPRAVLDHISGRAS
jgi:phosphoglycolate phosphatase